MSQHMPAFVRGWLECAALLRLAPNYGFEERLSGWIKIVRLRKSNSEWLGHNMNILGQELRSKMVENYSMVFISFCMLLCYCFQQMALIQHEASLLYLIEV